MKIAKSLLILFLTTNLSWAPCHASECVKELETTISSILNNNKYAIGTALALNVSFVAYKWFIAPAIENCHETLLNACKTGNLFLIKLFHLLGAEQIVKHGDTYINEAYENNHLEIIKYLLNIPPHDMHKPFIAYLIDDKTILNDCIQNSSYVNGQCCTTYMLHDLYQTAYRKTKKSLRDGDTLLHVACRNDDRALIETLLTNEADVNIKNRSGRNPLHMACANKNIDIAELLIKHDADINAQDNKCNTCLHIACKNNDLEMVRFLVNQKKIRLDAKTISGWGRSKNTCLHITCKKGYAKIVQLLLEKNSDVNIGNNYNQTPLQIACSKENLPIIKLLINHKSTTEKNKIIELFMACKYRKPLTLQVLLKNNVNPNAQDKNGDTVLHQISTCHIASNKKDEWSILQLLMNKKADINIQNKQGNTPLHLAAKKRGCLELIKYLIEMGADLMAENNNSETAYQLIGYENLYNYHKLRTESSNDATLEKIFMLKERTTHYSLEQYGIDSGYDDVVNIILNRYTTLLLNSVEARMWKQVLHEINFSDFCKNKYNPLSCQTMNNFVKQKISMLTPLSKDPDFSNDLEDGLDFNQFIENKKNDLCCCNDQNLNLSRLLCLPKKEKEELSMQLPDYQRAESKEISQQIRNSIQYNYITDHHLWLLPTLYSIEF
jgi:ankyrin repeat protein